MSLSASIHVISVFVLAACSAVALNAFFFWEQSLVPQRFALFLGELLLPFLVMLVTALVIRTMSEPRFAPLDAGMHFGGIYLAAITIVFLGAKVAQMQGIAVNLPPHPEGEMTLGKFYLAIVLSIAIFTAPVAVFLEALQRLMSSYR